MGEVSLTRLRANGMDLGCAVANLGRIIGPPGPALIADTPSPGKITAAGSSCRRRPAAAVQSIGANEDSIPIT